jgi:histidyl-tRNA synthetase
MAPKTKFELKVPKGTKDWEGTDMVIRDKIFNTITSVFKRHGGVTIDTPVFELREILAGKYGEARPTQTLRYPALLLLSKTVVSPCSPAPSS